MKNIGNFNNPYAEDITQQLQPQNKKNKDTSENGDESLKINKGNQRKHKLTGIVEIP